MSIAHYIKDIGRGKDGARALNQDQARDLLLQVLDGTVTDLEIGAFCVAMRIKGETTDELEGFLQAVHARTLALEAPGPIVSLPSYNGARKLPNLTPLLAAGLAREGVPVLVHGVEADAARVTTAALFEALAWPVAADAAAVQAAWATGRPVFMGLPALCPSLARLLAVRSAIGLRNSGHTLAKLLAPAGAERSIRVINYTHPEYAHAHLEWARQAHAHALLLRGTEGEPVADPRRMPRMDAVLGGEVQPDLCTPAQSGTLGTLPELPDRCAIEPTVAFIRKVLEGTAPMPGPVARQIETLAALYRTLAH